MQFPPHLSNLTKFFGVGQETVLLILTEVLADAQEALRQIVVEGLADSGQDKRFALAFGQK